MNKDIYIISNDINNLCYIGQTNNITLRWQQHKSAAKTRTGNCAVDYAMADLGIEHFSIQILESDVEDPDERERYWIGVKNTMAPNGYNRSGGGTSGNFGIISNSAKIRNETVLDEIRDAIQNTKMSFEVIGKKYGVSSAVISTINTGDAYYNSKFAYPLRESVYSKEKFKRLVYALKYETQKTLSEIAEEYDVDRSQLSKINQGKAHWVSWLQYPLRSGKVTNKACKLAPLIISDLRDSSMLQKDIAKKYGVSPSVVTQINLGRNYRQPDIKYPIRQTTQQDVVKLQLTEKEIDELETLLSQQDLSMREIAKRFGCNVEEIMSFNIGAINKYRRENRKYPIRKKSAHPVSTICA